MLFWCGPLVPGAGENIASGETSASKILWMNSCMPGLQARGRKRSVFLRSASRRGCLAVGYLQIKVGKHQNTYVACRASMNLGVIRAGRTACELWRVGCALFAALKCHAQFCRFNPLKLARIGLQQFREHVPRSIFQGHLDTKEVRAEPPIPLDWGIGVHGVPFNRHYVEKPRKHETIFTSIP